MFLQSVAMVREGAPSFLHCENVVFPVQALHIPSLMVPNMLSA